MVGVLATDYAYLAGIIDGEGCINTTSAHGDYFGRITVEMTDLGSISWLKYTFGGSVYGPRDRGSRRKPTYRWQLTKGEDISALCKMMLPYLKVKSEQAKLMISYYDDKIGWFINDEERSRRALIVYQLRNLNQRGI